MNKANSPKATASIDIPMQNLRNGVIKPSILRPYVK